MEILIKLGTNLQDIYTLDKRIWQAIRQLDKIWPQDHQLIITATTDGNHVPGSRHYYHEAIDIRKKTFMTHTWLSEARTLLGTNYLILDEGDHIHLQTRD